MSIILSYSISLLAFLAVFYCFRRTNFSIPRALFFILFVLVSITLYLLFGVANHLTGEGINDAVIYHLQYGLGGSGFLEYRNIFIIVTSLIIIGLFALVHTLVTVYKNKKSKMRYQYALLFLMPLSLLLSPATRDLYDKLGYQGQIVKIADAAEPEANVHPALYFDDFYNRPSITQIDKNKNLVIIYAEGLEQTYSDKDIFPGLTTGLDSLQAKSTYFTDIRQLSKTGYTIAGMVSSQCGLPLVWSPTHGNAMHGIDEYLPLASCMGDLLSAQDYYLAYYGGASLDFAGKGKFYKTHNFDEVKGSAELLPTIPDTSYRTGWGLYDDSLLDLAYQRFLALSESQDNFALVTLTLDTHHPNGHPSKSCQNISYADGSNSMLNAVACSDYLITNFVEDILDSPYAKDTLVVVVSDHLAQRNTASKYLNQAIRKNRFFIIDPDHASPTKVDQTGSTLDIVSTILPFMGYQANIGLGRDLISDTQDPLEIASIHTKLPAWQKNIATFWDFPEIEGCMKVDTVAEQITLSERTFSIPILIESGPKIGTASRLDFDPLLEEKSMSEYLDSIHPSTSFGIIERCNEVMKIDKVVDNYCFFHGNKKKYSVRLLADEEELCVAEVI